MRIHHPADARDPVAIAINESMVNCSPDDLPPRWRDKWRQYADAFTFRQYPTDRAQHVELAEANAFESVLKAMHEAMDLAPWMKRMGLREFACDD